MFHKTLSLSDAQLKFSKADAAAFAGYASVYNGVDSYGDTILPGAFDKAIRKAKQTQRMPKMFANHRSWEMPIGKWVDMKADDTGLYVVGEFTPGNPQAEIVRAAMLHGTVDGLSIGFRMSQDDYELVDDKSQRVIKNISDLIEISAVTFPADEGARIDLSTVKHDLEVIETVRDFEAFLRDAGGFSRGLASALATRARVIFERRDAVGDAESAVAELRRLIGTSLLV
jgi:HK97 family phage prohead protease